MAIDTRAKRAHVPGVGRPWMRGKNPDATKPEAWRIATGNAYAGTALSPVVPNVAQGQNRLAIPIGIGV